jgi:hypothetical protein
MPMRAWILDFSRLRRKPSNTCTTQKKLKRAWRFKLEAVPGPRRQAAQL